MYNEWFVNACAEAVAEDMNITADEVLAAATPDKIVRRARVLGYTGPLGNYVPDNLTRIEKRLVAREYLPADDPRRSFGVRDFQRIEENDDYWMTAKMYSDDPDFDPGAAVPSARRLGCLPPRRRR